MASVAPLSAREPRVLQVAGSAQVAAFLTPRQKNPLLVKDDVGRARTSCYDLPESGFAFGRPGNTDTEGAREVSMHWMSHTPSKAPEANYPDFVTWNKRAVAAKIITPKDVKFYRKEQSPQRPAPRTSPDSSPERRASGKASRYVIPSDVIPGFAYGRKVRPSTPIKEVITCRFAEVPEHSIQQRYVEARESLVAQRSQVRKIPLTAASRGHAMAAKKALLQPDEGKELFKLSKFKRVGPKVVNRDRHLLGSRLLQEGLVRQDSADSTVFSDSAPGLLVDEPRAASGKAAVERPPSSNTVPAV